jgi:beta-glucosidase
MEDLVMVRKTLVFLICLFVSDVFSQGLDQRIQGLLNQMTLEEKVYQLTHNTYFSTGDNARLNIPGFMMSDGPHGVRFGGATSFPVGIAMAATFNPLLVERVGQAMGEEFWAYGKDQQLGPCIDLCRDPRNGRSAETLGEDPFLAGEIGAAYVRGIQKTPVVATVKHFNLVNRQDYRHNSNAIISERGLMEHYGLNFRKTIQEGSALSVMNAYNLINGVHCSESTFLLTTILRERWGFPFYVVSDWGAVYNARNALLAGTDICMASDHYVNDIPSLINAGQLSMSDLDKAVARVLKTKLLNGMLDFYPRPPDGLIDSPEHRQLCLEAGRESIVLLKNEAEVLPLDKNQISKIAVIGPNAAIMQIDGFGSSWVDVIYAVSPLDGIKNTIGSSKVVYAQGCDINSTRTDGFAEALTLAEQADVVVYVGGLDQTQEGEGYGEGGDRKSGSVDLPGVQQDLINALATKNENLVVVLNSGGICGINASIQNIKGLLYAFYPGQEGGNAIAEVLFGDYNPAGRLPVTMPISDSQIQPRNDNFNDDFGCGYRWYDEMNIVPEFAFGFGLSYTTFAYSNISVSEISVSKGNPVTISVDVTNSGSREGEEVVQLYLTDTQSSIWMPQKQLAGFQRVSLLPGETKSVSFDLTADDFYFWNETKGEYDIESGLFTARVGGSSDNLPTNISFELMEGSTKPDLIISRIFSSPRYPVENDTVQFLALVRNIGTAPTSKGEEHRIEFSLGDQVLSVAVPTDVSIPQGGMYLIPVESGFWVPQEGGVFNIQAKANSAQSMNELLTTNNHLSTSIEVIDSMAYILNHNLALNKPIRASSYENGDLNASMAVDGSLNTRWSSQWSDPQYLTVDLEDYYTISKISVFWETAHASEYIIESSHDSLTWNTLVHEYNSDGGVDDWVLGDVANQRYVRLKGLQRATQWGYSIYELEVYGTLYNVELSAETTAEQAVYVWPNPSHSLIHIEGALGESSLLAYNVSGQAVSIESVAEGIYDISYLKNGIYFINLKNKVVKFIKTNP